MHFYYFLLRCLVASAINILFLQLSLSVNVLFFSYLFPYQAQIELIYSIISLNHFSSFIFLPPSVKVFLFSLILKARD